jgi:hypothetical protein
MIMLSSRIDLGTVHRQVGEGCGPVGFYVFRWLPAIGASAEIYIRIARREALATAARLPQEQRS